MILLDKVATKVHLTYDDGGENHKERVLVYIGVGTVGLHNTFIFVTLFVMKKLGMTIYSSN